LLTNALEDFTIRILIVAAVVSIVIETATASDDHRSTAWIEGFF
jgi:Ca2+ transporting ATPase